MERLERALASGVLDVLLERNHVVLAPTRAAALRDELEALIAPAVMPLANSARAGGGDKELTDRVAHQLADRVLESDHVDDIFASDQTIRRDARRVLDRLLVGYRRGELEVERIEGEGQDSSQNVTVPLLDLGYVVAEVSKRLEFGMLNDALDRAAATVSARLNSLTRGRVAVFELQPDADSSNHLALEEAVTEELVALIEAELVELPSLEQVLELAEVDCMSPAFGRAIQRSVIRTRAEYDCVAHCVSIDDNNVIATLTPQSEHAADHAGDAFTMFLQTLEEELTTPTQATIPPPAMTEESEDANQPSSRRKPQGCTALSPARKAPSTARDVVVHASASPAEEAQAGQVAANYSARW